MRGEQQLNILELFDGTSLASTGKNLVFGMCAGVTIELIVKSKLGSLKSLRLTGFLQWWPG